MQIVKKGTKQSHIYTKDNKRMEIQIDQHTIAKIIERGTNKEEIEDVIKNGVLYCGETNNHNGYRICLLREVGGVRCILPITIKQTFSILE